MVPENTRPLLPPDEKEALGTDDVPAPNPEAQETASDIPPEPPPPPPLRQATRFSLESMESPFMNPQPTPIHWAVGWADLMMTMFILFLVMFLYPTAKEAKSLRSTQQSQVGEVQTGSAETPSLGAMGNRDQGLGTQGKGSQTGGGQDANELVKPGTGTSAGQADNVLPTAKLFDLAKLTKNDEEFAKFAEIELSPDRTVRIVLAADLLFPSGKADLSLIAKDNIKKISELLQETPHNINVIGHTDNQPIRGGAFASNWELSVLRATTVARFLIEEMGVAASRVMISGKSFYQPQANNDTPINRAKNRRVEIIVSLDPPPTLPATNSTLLSKPREK